MPLHWPGKSWSRPAVEILRRRNFRNLWIANLFTDVSGHVRTVGVAWLALELTDSQFWVGLTLGSVAIPVIALGLLSGAVVDRLPRRSIITISQLLLGCLLFFRYVLTDSLGYLALLAPSSVHSWRGCCVGFLETCSWRVHGRAGGPEANLDRELPYGGFQQCGRDHCSGFGRLSDCPIRTGSHLHHCRGWLCTGGRVDS